MQIQQKACSWSNVPLGLGSGQRLHAKRSPPLWVFGPSPQGVVASLSGNHPPGLFLGLPERRAPGDSTYGGPFAIKLVLQSPPRGTGPSGGGALCL